MITANLQPNTMHVHYLTESVDQASENITCPEASCDALTKVIHKTEGLEEACPGENLLVSSPGSWHN